MNIKKIISAVLSVALLALSEPYSSYAFTGQYTDGDWTYDLLTYNDTGAWIRSYTGSERNIVVPDTLGGYPIIKMSSFYEGEIESVVLPKTINEGEHISFSTKYPLLLKSVTFTDNKAWLMNIRLSGTGIEELILPTVINHNKNMLRNCPNLKRVVFGKGNGTLEIASHYFQDCTSLEEVVFDGGYSELTLKRAFQNTNLKRIVLNCNTSLKNNPFYDCPELREIEVNGRIDAPEKTFSKCPLLENIIIDNTSGTADYKFLNHCPSLTKINSEAVFDEETGDFIPEYKDFIIRNFSNGDDIGFINQYVMWHIRDVVKNCTNDSMTDIEKAKALHDWVCRAVTYNHSNENYSGNHNDISPFITGETVCDGYARTLNLLLNEAGIESYIVTSENHLWNIAKIGGHYFHIDATWDDAENPLTDWFMLSDSEISAETSSHTDWKITVPSSLHEFQADTLPDCPYSMGDTNTDGRISVADMVRMSRYMLNAQEADADNLVLYDLDFSGSIDIFDMIKMRSIIMENTHGENINQLSNWLIGNAESINPESDLNSDGVIDVFDYIIMRSLIAK